MYKSLQAEFEKELKSVLSFWSEKAIREAST